MKMMKIICLYLKNIKLELDLSVEIISEIARKNDIDTSSLVSIVDEFESNYYLDSCRGLINNRHERLKLQKWKRLMPVVLSLDWLADTRDHLSVCFVNKSFAEKLLPRFYKKILSSTLKNDESRIEAWKGALGKVF
jgi:hypothetical protein